MLFWNHITGFFNKRNKQEKVPPTSSSPPQVTPPPKVPEHSSESETQTTTSSTVEEEIAPSIPRPLPEVEFEQSRNLLQLDFFGSTQEKENGWASFPKFDYLLEVNKKTPSDNNNNTLKKSRKSSITLRHRISLYRPSQQKAVKRSLSTPDIYNSK
ncbi:hypothetical protein EDC94DRAFT_662142 [Helicostylum pulchrum]|nr:hypothetical protein EDC94DRAFT_662142 [Helicostylum pulchrum]